MEPIFFCMHLFYYLTETGEFFVYIKEGTVYKVQFRVVHFGMR